MADSVSDALNIERLHAYLGGVLDNLPAELPAVQQFTGGVSNWTYGLTWPDRRLVLRRPPDGTKARSAHDMQRECHFQQALRPHFGTVPQMLHYCPDTDVIGADFYLMEWVDGLIVGRRTPDWSTSDAARVCTAYLDTLIALHSIDVTRPEIAALGKGEGYARRQIEGWNSRYKKARTWNVPRGTSIMAWLAERIPDDGRLAVVHNDFRLDNLVVNPQKPWEIRAVLDWELATIGDPLMDLGNALAYWVHADDDRFARASRKQPTHLPGMARREELVERYCDATGAQIDHWPFYEVYGLFRLSAIAQQIYYRYHHGQTRNPAFKRFWLSVHYLHWRARKIMRKAR